jgi:RNA polymerase subunit RPABC4/transcription elongation factor Spt4
MAARRQKGDMSSFAVITLLVVLIVAVIFFTTGYVLARVLI